MTPRVITKFSVFSVVLLFLVEVKAEVKAKQALHLGVLISQEGDFDFTGLIPAMNLALETIENDTTLPFRFTITLNDSMVSQCIVLPILRAAATCLSLLQGVIATAFKLA